MNKIYLFLIAMLIASTLFSQDEVSSKKVTIEYEFGVGLYAGKYGANPYPIINPSNSSTPVLAIIKQEPSYIGAINFRFPMERLTFVSGIGYTVFNAQFNATQRSVFAGNDGKANSTLYLALYPKDMHFLAIPMVFEKQFSDFLLEFGLENRILLGATGKRLLESKMFRSNSVQVSEPTDITARSSYIVTHGMKAYHVQARFAVKVLLNEWVGLKLQYNKPLTRLAEKAEDIPSGRPLFQDGEVRPGGFSIHFFLRNVNHQNKLK